MCLYGVGCGNSLLTPIEQAIYRNLCVAEVDDQAIRHPSDTHPTSIRHPSATNLTPIYHRLIDDHFQALFHLTPI